MTSKLEVSDLANADFSSKQIRDLGILPSPGFSVDGGDLVFRKNATLGTNQSNTGQQILESLFVEVNASDLAFNIGNDRLLISKFIAFVTDFSPRNSFNCKCLCQPYLEQSNRSGGSKNAKETVGFQ